MICSFDLFCLKTPKTNLESFPSVEQAWSKHGSWRQRLASVRRHHMPWICHILRWRIRYKYAQRRPQANARQRRHHPSSEPAGEGGGRTHATLPPSRVLCSHTCLHLFEAEIAFYGRTGPGDQGLVSRDQGPGPETRDQGTRTKDQGVFSGSIRFYSMHPSAAVGSNVLEKVVQSMMKPVNVKLHDKKTNYRIHEFLASLNFVS